MLTEESAATTVEGAPGKTFRVLRLSASEWALLLVLAAMQFTHIIDFVIVMPLGPTLQDALRLSTAEFGWVVTAYGVSASAVSLLAAKFLDRYDRKKSLLVLFSGFAVGTLLCAAAPDFTVLLAARAVAGGFAGVMGANVLIIVSDVFPESRRATAMGVVMSSFSVANIIGIYLGLELADALGWRAPFTVLGLLCVPMLLLAWRVLPPLRGHLGRRARSGVSLRQVLLHPNNVRAYSLTTALMMGSWTIIPFVAIYAVNNVGLPKADLRWIWLTGGVATLLTMTPTGWVADRLDKLMVFRVIGVLCVVPVLFVTNLPPTTLTVTLLATTLFMVATSIRWVPVMAMITASVPPYQRGSFMSVNASVQQMVMGLAPLISGLILGQDADEHAAKPLMGFPVVGLIAAASMIASVLLAGRLRRREAPESQPTREVAAEPAVF
jgi:predicted MFS family arabinose efflux permease